MEPVIRARGLVVERGGFRLGPIDLEMSEGEYLVLVGPSGSGKTVLLETIIGWHRPVSGGVELDGERVIDIPPGRRGIAYVPQDLGLLPHRPVRENLEWGVRCRGRRPDPDLYRELVEVLGLGHLMDRETPATLSRGERQRVALGRALLTRPRLLVLDEPCAALDPHLRRGFQLMLRRIHRQRRTTVLHVTHDREEAFLLGDRIGVVLGGRIRQLASPRRLYDHPAHTDVARFLTPENLWPAVVTRVVGEDTLVELQAWSVHLAVRRRCRLPEGSAVLAGIRPEEVMVLQPGRPLRPQVQGNVMGCVVEELLMLDGSVEARLRADCGLRVTTRLPVCAAYDLGLREGMTVRASLKPRSVFLLEPAEEML